MNIARPAAFSLNHASSSATVAPERSDAIGVAPAAGWAGFRTELANDPLGIVAGYLSQSDQLVMRQASDDVRQVVDAGVRRLTLTGAQACDLLARPDAFRHLSELHLTQCDDDALCALADIVRHRAGPALALVIEGDAGVALGAAGARAIASLNLSRIALHELAVPPEAAMALAESPAPVSITLPLGSDSRSRLYGISQIPTLTSLCVGTHLLSAASVETLRSHPVLTTLSVATLSAQDVRKLAGCPRLQSLSVHYVAGDATQALAALASSTTLTSLAVGRIKRAEDIVTLARSRTMRALTLYMSVGAASGLPALARMPALAHLSLQGWGRHVPVAADDIAALCARPLRSLTLTKLEMDAAGAAHVAAFRASSLSREDGGQVTDAEAIVLAASLGVLSGVSALSRRIEMASEMANEVGALWA